MNPEALEAFKRFAQRKGLSEDDISIPTQTGEGPALCVPRSSPRPSLCPLLLHFTPPRPSCPSPDPPWGDVSAVLGHRATRVPAPGHRDVSELRAVRGLAWSGAPAHPWVCFGLYRRLPSGEQLG